jgi:ankyrin repeat protein
MPRRLSSATTLDTLRREAKRWLKRLQSNGSDARERLARALPQAPVAPRIRDVQLALAREHGFAGWIALKAAVERNAQPTPRRHDLIQPPELASVEPYGPSGSRGCDVWEAIEVARRGDDAALQVLLARDPRLAHYAQPLRFAVQEGRTTVVSTLLAGGADPDGLSSGGESLATIARDRGHDEVAQVIERAGRSGRRAQAAQAGTADHLIHDAVVSGDLDGVQRLLDADPDLIRSTTRFGSTPLHRAVAARDARMITLLIDRGADVHTRHGAGPGSEDGYPPVDCEPIDIALFWQGRYDVETARLLQARGAAYDLTIAAALGDRAAVAAMLDGDLARIRETRPSGKRPLSAAVEAGHDDIAELLLDRGADPTWSEGVDAPRGAALHAAARLGNRPLVERLLHHGADPNAHVDSAGSATWAAKTPELRALLMAHGGQLDCYDLIWLGEDDEAVRRVAANPREANAGCGGVFTVAATMGKRDLVVRLLAAGARVPATLTACRSYLLEDPEILRLLLESGMDPNLPDWQRATLLHALAGRDQRGRPRPHRIECAAVLLDAGASISVRDEEYRSTPLAWAARNDLPDVVAFLLDRGAPTNLSDDEPWATPLAWAVKRGRHHIEELLHAAGART